jgi:hypothetical protein
LPQAPNTAESILAEIDLEIVKLQTELLSEKDLQKITEQIENQYVNSNATIDGTKNAMLSPTTFTVGEHHKHPMNEVH